MELVEMVDHAVEEVLQSTIDIPPNFSAFQAPEDTDVACPADSVVGSSVGSLSSSIEIVYESGYWRVFHGLQFVGGSKDKRRAAVMADLATIILGSGSQEGTMQLAYPEQFYATFKGDERWATRGIDELRVALSACPKRGNLTSPYAGVDLSLKTVKLGGEGQLQQTISFRSEASWASKKCSTGSHASEEDGAFARDLGLIFIALHARELESHVPPPTLQSSLNMPERIHGGHVDWLAGLSVDEFKEHVSNGTLIPKANTCTRPVGEGALTGVDLLTELSATCMENFYARESAAGGDMGRNKSWYGARLTAPLDKAQEDKLKQWEQGLADEMADAVISYLHDINSIEGYESVQFSICVASALTAFTEIGLTPFADKYFLSEDGEPLGTGVTLQTVLKRQGGLQVILGLWRGRVGARIANLVEGKVHARALACPQLKPTLDGREDDGEHAGKAKACITQRLRGCGGTVTPRRVAEAVWEEHGYHVLGLAIHPYGAPEGHAFSPSSRLSPLQMAKVQRLAAANKAQPQGAIPALPPPPSKVVHMETKDDGTPFLRPNSLDRKGFTFPLGSKNTRDLRKYLYKLTDAN